MNVKLYVNIFFGENIIVEAKEENGKSNKCDIEHVCFLEEVFYYLEWFEFYSVLFKMLKLPFIQNVLLFAKGEKNYIFLLQCYDI